MVFGYFTKPGFLSEWNMFCLKGSLRRITCSIEFIIFPLYRIVYDIIGYPLIFSIITYNMVLKMDLPAMMYSQTVVMLGYGRFVGSNGGWNRVFADMLKSLLTDGLYIYPSFGLGIGPGFYSIPCLYYRFIQYQNPMNMVGHEHKIAQFHIFWMIENFVPQNIGNHTQMR